MDIVVLNFKFFSFGSFADHQQFVYPFLLDIHARGAYLLVYSPYISTIVTLYFFSPLEF